LRHDDPPRENQLGILPGTGGAIVQPPVFIAINYWWRLLHDAGFVLLPRRWVVERTIAWLNRNRRLAKDFEATTESSVTWLYIASVKLMSRRLATA